VQKPLPSQVARVRVVFLGRSTVEANARETHERSKSLSDPFKKDRKKMKRIDFFLRDKWRELKIGCLRVKRLNEKVTKHQKRGLGLVQTVSNHYYSPDFFIQINDQT
jgi:hypothetical protein